MTNTYLTEGTGGGCTALVRYNDNGTVCVVTDGNLGTDLDAAGESTGAVFATREDWEDSGQDPVFSVFGTSAEIFAALDAWSA